MNTQSTDDASKPPYFDYTAPFVAFMAFLLLPDLVRFLVPNTANIWIAHPTLIIFPLQTIVCGALLIKAFPKIDFRGIAYISVVFAVGFFVFAIWTSPQFFRWAGPRTDGFNPDILEPGSASYWLTVGFRFLRLVIVVPFLEEIFWRGFLMRWLINEKFHTVPFGTFQWKAFVITAVGFTLEHQRVDWPVAIITAIIFNLVACQTKSLGSCVFVHAVTNLFLGLYIMFTKQWGFW